MQAVRQNMVSPQSRETKDLPHVQNPLLEHAKEGKKIIKTLRNAASKMKSSVSLPLILVLIMTVVPGFIPSAHGTPITFHFSDPTSVTINGFVDVISGTFTLDPSLTGTGVLDVLAADIVVSSGDPQLVGVYHPAIPWTYPATFPGQVDTQDFNQINLISPSGILGLIFAKDYSNPPPVDLDRAFLDLNGGSGTCTFFTGYCWATAVVGEAVSTSGVQQATPEPDTLLMLGSGFLVLAGVLRRKLTR
jgi:hypothetical protein